MWRFESNGWPTERLHAIDVPYPLARDEDAREQPGRTSTAEHMAYLKSEVEAVIEPHRRDKVDPGRQLARRLRDPQLRPERRRRDGGEPRHPCRHAQPRHLGRQGYAREQRVLRHRPVPDQPQHAEERQRRRSRRQAVKWLTIRSDNNDKYAQPDGLWIGSRGTATNVSYAGPELLGATNVVLPGVDHRETAFSPAAFDAMYRFITGEAPRTLEIEPDEKLVLNGTITGLGLNRTIRHPATSPTTCRCPARACRSTQSTRDTGERLGEAVHDKPSAATAAGAPSTPRTAWPTNSSSAPTAIRSTTSIAAPFRARAT